MSSTRPESDPGSRQRGTEPQAPCLVGLIGRGIQASKSPTLHESEAAAQGLRLIYELMDLDERGGLTFVQSGGLRCLDASADEPDETRCLRLGAPLAAAWIGLGTGAAHAVASKTTN